MQVWRIKIHLIKYQNSITEKDNLVTASSMDPYKDALGMQHIQKAKGGE